MGLRKQCMLGKDIYELLTENTQTGSVSTADKVGSHRADLAALSPFVNEMGCFEMADYKVSKWATICMKTSHYSVPDTLVGKTVAT